MDDGATVVHKFHKHELVLPSTLVNQVSSKDYVGLVSTTVTIWQTDRTPCVLNTITTDQLND